MKKLAILIIALYLFSCGHDDDPYERCPYYSDFESVTYETFDLLDSNLDWKWDASLSMIEFWDPKKPITFFKPGNFTKYYSFFDIEHVERDEEKCIESGNNQVRIQAEYEQWLSISAAVEIHLSRVASVIKPEHFVLDSLQSYYKGDRFIIQFKNPYGLFYLPGETPYVNYIKQQIDTIKEFIYMSNKWTDVIEIQYLEAPYGYDYYMEAVYLKKGFGIICFRSTKYEWWGVKI